MTDDEQAEECELVWLVRSALAGQAEELTRAGCAMAEMCVGAGLQRMEARGCEVRVARSRPGLMGSGRGMMVVMRGGPEGRTARPYDWHWRRR